MRDGDRVGLIRTFLEGLEEQNEAAEQRGEPFAIDGVSTIELLRAIVNGANKHAPDFAMFKDRLALFQAAKKYTVCIAMTGWTTTPAPKKEPA